MNGDDGRGCDSDDGHTYVAVTTLLYWKYSNLYILNITNDSKIMCFDTISDGEGECWQISKCEIVKLRNWNYKSTKMRCCDCISDVIQQEWSRNFEIWYPVKNYDRISKTIYNRSSTFENVKMPESQFVFCLMIFVNECGPLNQRLLISAMLRSSQAADKQKEANIRENGYF